MVVTAIVYYFIVAFAVVSVVALAQQLLRSVREFRAGFAEVESEASVLSTSLS